MARFSWIALFLACSAHAAVITGKVSAPDGAAIADATVWLWQEQGVQRAQTQADGVYSFPSVPVGTIELVALKEGFALGGAARFAVGDAAIDIALAPAAEIHLKVLVPGQQPAPGARVYALMVNDAFVVPVEDLVPHGFPQWRSGDDGALTITNLPVDGHVKVNLKHLDFADTYVDFVPVRERPTPVLLEPGVLLRGRVTDGAKPVANARVHAFQLSNAGQREFARTQTDAEGLYNMRLAAGEYLTAARHPDFASPAPAQVRVNKESTEDLPDIALLAPYRLRGTVVFPDGAPCPGARVTYREKDTIYDDTFTGSDGAFSIKAGSPKGTLRIGAPEGYKTEILADIKVNLGDKHEATIEPIRLSKLPAIEGTVTLEDGTPGAQVLIASLNTPQGIWMITDEQGRFHFQLGADQDAAEIVFLAEHAERFQRAQFVYPLQAPTPAAVTLKSYSPDEVQPEAPAGTNDLSAVIDQKAPEIKCGSWFNGDAVTLDSLKGKVAVLLFWAGFDTTIEGVNKVELMRALIALYKDDPQLRFVALHDSTSEAAEVSEFVKQTGLSCPVGLDAEPLVTFGAYRVNFIPELVLLDKKNNIRYFQPGPRILEFIKILRRRAP